MAVPDSIALVTGAANGIGKATAERFADDDRYDSVALLDVEDKVHDVADTLNAVGYTVDIRNQSRVMEIVDELEAVGEITAAVNNAAVSAYEWIGDLELEEWNRVLNINLTGQYNVIRAVGPRMYDRKHGYIVNVSSGAGQRGSASGGVHYSASKAGIFGLTKGCAKQLSPHVHVNCVVPGLIDTRLTVDSDLWTKSEIEEFLEEVPIGRLGDPDEVGRVIHFLCGSGAEFMTGSVVNVDGGADLA